MIEVCFDKPNILTTRHEHFLQCEEMGAPQNVIEPPVEFHIPEESTFLLDSRHPIRLTPRLREYVSSYLSCTPTVTDFDRKLIASREVISPEKGFLAEVRHAANYGYEFAKYYASGNWGFLCDPKFGSCDPVSRGITAYFNRRNVTAETLSSRERTHYFPVVTINDEKWLIDATYKQFLLDPFFASSEHKEELTKFPDVMAIKITSKEQMAEAFRAHGLPDDLHDTWFCVLFTESYPPGHRFADERIIDWLRARVETDNPSSEI